MGKESSLIPVMSYTQGFCSKEMSAAEGGVSRGVTSDPENTWRRGPISTNYS